MLTTHHEWVALCERKPKWRSWAMRKPPEPPPLAPKTDGKLLGPEAKNQERPSAANDSHPEVTTESNSTSDLASTRVTANALDSSDQPKAIDPKSEPPPGQSA